MGLVNSVASLQALLLQRGFDKFGQPLPPSPWPWRLAALFTLFLLLRPRIMRLMQPAMVTCANCGTRVGREASKCPQCQKPLAAAPSTQPERIVNCRSCGTPLSENAHRTVRIGHQTIGQSASTFSGTVSGSSVYGSVSGGGDISAATYKVSHSPCPKCGDRMPARRLIDIPVVNFAWSLLVVVVFIGSGFYYIEARWISGDGVIWAWAITAVALYYASRRLYT